MRCRLSLSYSLLQRDMKMTHRTTAARESAESALQTNTRQYRDRLSWRDGMVRTQENGINNKCPVTCYGIQYR